MFRRACPILALLLAVPAAARAVEPFDSFRIPEYRTFNWNGTLGGSASGTHDDRSSPFFSSRSDDGRFWGSASTSFDWARVTDPTVATLSGTATISGNRYTQREGTRSLSAYASTNATQRYRTSTGYERFTISASRSQYPFAVPVFYSVSLGASLQDDQRWTSNDRRYDTTDPVGTRSGIDVQGELRKSYGGDIHEALGIGIGRVRDASPLYEAVLLEERLARTGLLLHPLSTEARRKLGALMYTRASYATTRDRPARDLWAGIVRILEEDGALRSPAGPQTVMRLMEPFLGPQGDTGRDGLPVAPLRRKVGMSVTINAVDMHRRETTHYVSTRTTETIPGSGPEWDSEGDIARQTRDDLNVALFADFNRPLSERWQLDATGTVSGGARHSVDANYSAQVTASWLMADRWLASVRGTESWYDAKRTAGPSGQDQADWQASASLAWYVESRTALSLSVSHRQAWRRGDSAVAHEFGRTTGISVGVSHRFAGHFDAPLLALSPTTPTIDLQP